MSRPEQTLFRQEALEQYAAGASEGSPLRLTPFWVRATFWVLAGALAMSLLGLMLASVHEYAAGPAFIRVEGSHALTVPAPGIVSTILVRPGQRVRTGQVLVQLYVAEELAERDRLQHELEAQLTRRLLDLQDESARQALTSLRAQLALAQARLDERSVRAPDDGVVSDIRIRPGQAVGPGDVLLSLLGDEATLSVVALLPGQSRPMLREGGPLRLELSGFPYEYRDLSITSIGDELVGPTEVRRFLGPERADAVSLQGPLVIVQARLPSREFLSGGRTYRYYDGMAGQVQAQIRSRRALVALLPILQPLVNSHD